MKSNVIDTEDWEVVAEVPKSLKGLRQVSIYFGSKDVLHLRGTPQKFKEFAHVWWDAWKVEESERGVRKGQGKHPPKSLLNIGQGLEVWFTVPEAAKALGLASWANAESMAKKLGIPPGTFRSELVKEQRKKTPKDWPGREFYLTYKGVKLQAYRGGRTWWVRGV